MRIELCEIHLTMLEAGEFWMDATAPDEALVAVSYLEKLGLAEVERDESNGFTVLNFTVTHRGKHASLHLLDKTLN